MESHRRRLHRQRALVIQLGIAAARAVQTDRQRHFYHIRHIVPVKIKHTIWTELSSRTGYRVNSPIVLECTRFELSYLVRWSVCSRRALRVGQIFLLDPI